ncbi:MAG: acetyl-CoA carboxylase biotin carboxyl carrier protein [Planctomycetes bacterium]|nr:acetyl-CoA carboxylase biotin carboxyl carrier protein [Planctomycetota bacterium]
MAARKSTKSKATAARAASRSTSTANGAKRGGGGSAAAKSPAAKDSGAKAAGARGGGGGTKGGATKAGGAKAGGAKAGGAKAGGAKAGGAKGAARFDRVAEIQRVIDVMVAAGAVEVELEDGGSKLRVRLREERPATVVAGYPAPAALAGPLGAPALSVAASVGSGAPGSEPAATPAVDDGRRQIFKSPMVGTFYRSPSPEADPYVRVGDQIGQDSTLCILEAMKVMNEIKAEMEGRVVEILVQNGEPVEFGQPLFVIEVD